MTPRVAAISAPAVAVAALAAATLAAAALPAVAAQTSHRDATGDVVLLGVENDSVTPQPSWKAGDIRRIGVAHRVHLVSVRLGFRDVARRTSNSYSYHIRTPHRGFWLIGYTAHEEPQGSWFLIRPNRGTPLRCAGLHHRVDYANEKVKVSLPRRCIGVPARVRVGASATTWIDAKEQTRRDDAYSTNRAERTVLGPWLRRA